MNYGLGLRSWGLGLGLGLGFTFGLLVLSIHLGGEFVLALTLDLVVRRGRSICI